LFGIFKKTELLDEEIIQWLFETYEWIFKNFDANVFFQETVLVTPSNKHFPGSSNTADGMANLIFNQVREYAGMQRWPCSVLDENQITNFSQPNIQIEGPLRGRHAQPLITTTDNQPLIITYHPFQLKDPEVLIASFAHTLAFYLGLSAKEPPPGGSENLPHATELLAIFMGFGVIMANSANTRKIRSCGSCSGPAIERTNYLSQFDTCYALAIFTLLLGISKDDVLFSLKKNLRPFFKKAIKDVQARVPELSNLQSYKLTTQIS